MNKKGHINYKENKEPIGCIVINEDKDNGLVEMDGR